MKDNIIVIGAGIETGMIGKTVAHLLPNDVILVDVKEVKKEQIPFPNDQPFVLKNPYAKIQEAEKPNKFICKGKHSYTEVKGNWICQCGRNMND